MLYLGIDGEGQGRNPHRYTLLACASRDRSFVRSIENPDGLHTKECLDFLLSLPTRKTMVSAFAFNYDLTKILQDVENPILYELFRPESREGKFGPRPVLWDCRPYSPFNIDDPDSMYWLNLIGSKFVVEKGKNSRIIWDTFKFYGEKFVSACRTWNTGSKEELDHMQKMKEKRSEFDSMSHEDVRSYCYQECAFMAEQTEKLVAAHEQAEIPLTSFYGAGSSAGAILKILGVKDKRREPIPAMAHAVACSFSGGRFEHSAVGAIRVPVTNWDISSAYPYQITFLPCLEHGTWKLTRSEKRMREARSALVHYRLGKAPRKYTSWGPFPYRIGSGKEKGSICYPIESAGGWVWREEFLAGARVFSHVEFREAWVYECECDCQPFKQIPLWYLERLAIGKEGPGIVIKLALNSLYGKMAQSVGNAQYQCWIWASMVTSGCRAQVLDVLALHEDHADLLMVATDGIRTRDPRLACDKQGKPTGIPLPTPRDSGTDVEVIDRSKNEKTRKPLGGWEGKHEKRGVFLARPGIYFPMHPSEEDLKEIKARGLGRGFLLDNWRKIVDTYEKGDEYGNRGIESEVRLAGLERFCGAKTSISFGAEGSTEYRRAQGGRVEHDDGTWHAAPSYGEWVARQVKLSFAPAPKRDGVGKDGTSLTLRRFPRDGAESAPYKKNVISKESLDLLLAEIEMLEQPDADYSTIGDGRFEGGI